MNITVREDDNTVILDLEGNIDINASNLIEAVAWALKNKPKNILCNFEDVQAVDYVGISVIAVAYKNVLNHDGQMKFCNVSEEVKKVFAVVGLNKIFESSLTEEQALESFKHDKEEPGISAKQLRRRFKRVPFCGTVEYKQKFSPADVFYKGKIINISGIGAFVTAEKIFDLGEILSANMRLSARLQGLEVEAKVVWIADKEIQPLASPAMGIEFCNMDPETQRLIVEFVERNLAANE